MMEESESDRYFDLFWQASQLDRFSIQRFASQLNQYDSDNKTLQLDYPLAATPLPKPSGHLLKRRASGRQFNDNPLDTHDLSTILSAFYAWNGLEHRGFPSAGATYCTEVFGVEFSGQKRIFYYDAAAHGTVTIGQAPSWNDARPRLNIEVSGTPGLLVVLTSFPQRAMAKYGERGGRFALLEAGAALECLSLQIAGSRKLKGVAVGGMFDEYWLQQLKLQASDARIAAGYLVGR